jgi:dipeptidase
MQRGKEIDLQAVISVLRDHGDESTHLWAPDKGIVGCNICMHAGFGPVRISQTTGSMASYLHPERATHFLTGTAAPCTGIFKPVWTDVSIPDTGSEPGGEYDGSSLFWRHEKLHRATLTDYAHRLSFYRKDRDVLENAFIQNALSLAFEPADQRENFSRKCFESADASEKIWHDRIKGERVEKHRRRFYSLAWKKFNQQAEMPDQDIG